VDQERVDKLLSIGFNDPPPRSHDEDGMLHSTDLQQRKRARRMARLKRTSGQQMQQSPQHAHHPHHAFQHYPEHNNIQHYPPAPHYEYDPNESVDNYYQGYDQHGVPVAQDGNSHFAENNQVYHHQEYEQYTEQYQTGV
jgi:hypothetical protein